MRCGERGGTNGRVQSSCTRQMGQKRCDKWGGEPGEIGRNGGGKWREEMAGGNGGKEWRGKIAGRHGSHVRLSLM